MVSLAQNLNAAFLSVTKTVKTSSGSAINIAICLVTIGSEQLFSFAIFSCPCSSSTNHSKGASESWQAHQMYGTVFIIVPAFALFCLGCAMNLRTWKMMTGCCKRHGKAARGYIAGCCTLSEILLQAMVAPMAWISIAFLDGKYYACAMADESYDMTCDQVIRTAAKKLRYTVEYEQLRQKSQVIGWCIIATTMFVGGIIFMCYRWWSPLTYNQRHYMKWYQEIEKQQFEELAREQITEETNENAAFFLKHRREKEFWDKISTVFTHTKDKQGFEVYSRLDQWCEAVMPIKGTSYVNNDEPQPSDITDVSDASHQNGSPPLEHNVETTDPTSHGTGEMIEMTPARKSLQIARNSLNRSLNDLDETMNLLDSKEMTDTTC